MIHAPKRLAILAILRGTAVVEFQYLKDELDLSDSDLSKQMAALTSAGIVTARKRRIDSKRSTWYRITSKGKRAFDRHVQSLETLIEMSKQLDLDTSDLESAGGSTDGTDAASQPTSGPVT